MNDRPIKIACGVFIVASLGFSPCSTGLWIESILWRQFFAINVCVVQRLKGFFGGAEIVGLEKFPRDLARDFKEFFEGSGSVGRPTGPFFVMKAAIPLIPVERSK